MLEWVAIPFALSYEDKVYARFLGIDETEERSGVSRIASNLRNIEEKIVPAILGNTAGLPISPDTRFIDIGSGSGIVVLYFALRFGIQATGIELDERQYRIAETLKAYLVKEGDIKEDQVTFIHGDATMFPFDSYQIAYYHSPYPTWRATDLDLAIFSKIIKELPLGGQFVSTLKEIPEYLMSEGELTLRTVLANQGDNAGDLNILGSINVIAASIYTKTSSMKPYAYPELLAALSSRQPLDNSL
ncbi:MAG: class I SAM-dependent methyltransferase [Candidatus Omnitrophica bacterium]|nr:class I SAM-dependent methyltransferase [Candidatus Omnitrophota bacterium]